MGLRKSSAENEIQNKSEFMNGILFVLSLNMFMKKPNFVLSLGIEYCLYRTNVTY